jgi:polyisoprenoid-binding protein YceI
MKKKLLILLAIVIAVVIIGFIVLKIMTKNAERHVETEKGIVITAAQLVTAFNTSEDSANKQYLNKTLELTGIVASVDTNENHQSVILLKTPEASTGVLCTFKKNIGSVKVGNTITCKGICTGFLSNVTVTDGVLLSVESIQAVVTIDTSKLIPPPPPPTPVIKDTVQAKTIKVFSTTKAQIQFDAGGGVEDIKASNNQAEASITTEGVVKFKLAVLGFKFSDALMQEHFNDSYLESKKYPTASFAGTITNIKDIDLVKDGTYKATVTGNLTMHGITQRITTGATLTVQNGKLKAQSSLTVKMDDYKISNDATSSAVLTITANF